jgi:hypothetical protein
MTHIGELRGAGTLRSAEGQECQVGYTIGIWQRGGLKGGDGTIDGDFRDLFTMFNSRDHLMLELENGDAVRVMISHLGSTSLTRIKTSGPIPGF